MNSLAAPVDHCTDADAPEDGTEKETCKEERKLPPSGSRSNDAAA
jgi:hypothetical protein